MISLFWSSTLIYIVSILVLVQSAIGLVTYDRIVGDGMTRKGLDCLDCTADENKDLCKTRRSTSIGTYCGNYSKCMPISQQQKLRGPDKSVDDIGDVDAAYQDPKGNRFPHR